MTTEPAGHEDLAGLLEKLSTDDYSLIGAEIYKREAHAAIIKLEQENARLREQRGIDADTFDKVRETIKCTNFPNVNRLSFTEATHKVFEIITQFHFGHGGVDGRLG